MERIYMTISGRPHEINKLNTKIKVMLNSSLKFGDSYRDFLDIEEEGIKILQHKGYVNHYSNEKSSLYSHLRTTFGLNLGKKKAIVSRLTLKLCADNHLELRKLAGKLDGLNKNFEIQHELEN